MRRIAILMLSLCGLAALTGFVAAGPASALEGEEPPAWTVNGKVLGPGETQPVKLTSTTPMRLTVPDLGLSVECQRMSGKGTLEGGEPGETTLASTKFSKCAGGRGGGGLKASIVIEIPSKCRTDGNWYNPFSWTWSDCVIKITIGSESVATSGKKVKEQFHGEGVVDAVLTESAHVEFPETPLPSETLTVEGDEAILSGEAVLTLKRHAVLGAGHV